MPASNTEGQQDLLVQMAARDRKELDLTFKYVFICYNGLLLKSYGIRGCHSKPIKGHVKKDPTIKNMKNFGENQNLCIALPLFLETNLSSAFR